MLINQTDTTPINELGSDILPQEETNIMIQSLGHAQSISVDKYTVPVPKFHLYFDSLCHILN